MSFDKQNYWRRILQSEIRNLATAESEGRQKPPPTPFIFAVHLPKRFSLAREACCQFYSKTVRISLNKRATIRFSGILLIDYAALRSAESVGKIPESLIMVEMPGVEPGSGKAY